MNEKELFEYIDELLGDVDFIYKGRDGSICPSSRSNIVLTYDGDYIELDSVEKLMESDFIDDVPLKKICKYFEI